MNKLDEFKTAAELAAESSPEVKYFIYAYKDTALNKYNPPFVQDKDPAFMVDALKNSIIKGTAKQRELVGLELVFIGTFELTTGKTEKYDTPALIANLDVLFEKFGGIDDGKVA